jgi:cell division protease FtsH
MFGDTSMPTMDRLFALMGDALGERSRGKLLGSSRSVLALESLAAILPVSFWKQVKSGGPLTALIAVPTSEWIEPVAETLLRLSEHAIVAVVPPERPREKESLKQTVGEAIAQGAVVLGIANDPRLLPPEIVNYADYRFVLPAIEPSIVRRVMRWVQTGPVPRTLNRLNLSSLDFNEVAAAIPVGGRSAASVERLATAISTKASPKRRSAIALPSLDEAIEYGAAREWALDLKQDLADARAGRIDISAVDRGCVLFGPPGVGKSLFAEMVGNACGLPVITSSLGQMFANGGGHLGDVIRALRQVFDRAVSAAPAVLFIDELNALPNLEGLDKKNRDFWTPLVLDFYVLLDSAMSDRDGVIVIGATNRIEDISEALLRPGRFERKIFVGAPDAVGLKRIIRHHLGADLREVDIAQIVAAARGATGAMVMEFVRKARRTARRASRPMQLDDLMDAVTPPDVRTHAERWKIAVHEAGHAVVGIATGDTLLEVSTVGTAAEGGHAAFDTMTVGSLAQVKKRLVVLLSGHAAETEIFGAASTGSGGSETSDLALATRAVAMLRASFGMLGNLTWLGPPEEVESLLRSNAAFAKVVEGDLQRIHAESMRLVRGHRAAILAVANELMQRGRLTHEAVRKAVGIADQNEDQIAA